MAKERCTFETQQALCNSVLKKESCPQFSSCSSAHNDNKGDLTPAQFSEKHPELSIDLIVRILKKQQSLTPEVKTPLRLFDVSVLNLTYIIPETDTCGLEGKDGRADPCPNNPIRKPDQHMPRICRACPTSPSVAPSSLDKLPEVYVLLREHRFKK